MTDRKTNLDTGKIKEASWPTIGLFLLLDWAFVIFFVAVVKKQGWLNFIPASTNQIINLTLVFSLIMIGFIVYGLLIKFGRLKKEDLGLKKGGLGLALIGAAIVFVTVNIINGAASLIFNGSLAISEEYSKLTFTYLIGTVIGQVFGNALFEELGYRGFLFAQLHKKFSKQKSGFIPALLTSQFLFCIMHIPNMVVSGEDFLSVIFSLPFLFALGILFALVYWVTGNIYLAILIHALNNLPISPVSGIPTPYLVFAVTLVLLWIWPKTFGKGKAEAQ